MKITKIKIPKKSMKRKHDTMKSSMDTGMYHLNTNHITSIYNSKYIGIVDGNESYNKNVTKLIKYFVDNNLHLPIELNFYYLNNYIYRHYNAPCEWIGMNGMMRLTKLPVSFKPDLDLVFDNNIKYSSTLIDYSDLSQLKLAHVGNIDVYYWIVSYNCCSNPYKLTNPIEIKRNIYDTNFTCTNHMIESPTVVDFSKLYPGEKMFIIIGSSKLWIHTNLIQVQNIVMKMDKFGLSMNIISKYIAKLGAINNICAVYNLKHIDVMNDLEKYDINNISVMISKISL